MRMSLGRADRYQYCSLHLRPSQVQVMCNGTGRTHAMHTNVHHKYG